MGKRKVKSYGLDHGLPEASALQDGQSMLPYHRRVFLVPVLALIVLIVMSGEAMLTAALPQISHDFAAPGVFNSWVLPMVLLVGAAGAPFIGTAGDRFGRRKLLLLCLCIYILGLFLGLVADNIVVLLFSRAMQGIGIACFPLAYALVRDNLPERESDVGIGILSAMYGAGMFVGVIIGSFMTELFSWRTAYLALIPAALFLILLTIRFIPGSRPEMPERIETQGLDWWGFITLLSALFLGLVSLSLPDSGQEVLRITCGALALCLALVFFRIELRIKRPLVDIRMAAKRPALLLLGIGTLTLFLFMMLLQEMPFLIQSSTGLGLSAGFVGLVLMPGTLSDMISGPLTGRLVLSRGVRPACIIGSVLLLLASGFLLAGIPSLPVLAIVWMLFSAGMSVTTTACIIAYISFFPPSRTAEATGFVQSVQTIGAMVGPVITGVVLAEATVSSMRNGSVWSEPASFTFTHLHGVALIFSLMILFCSALIKTRQERDSGPANTRAP
jgi:MFS family permease